MISVNALIFIFLIHFLGDFALQTSYQAENKHSNNKALGMHVLTYSLVWFIAAFCFLGSWTLALSFASLTYACHVLTDYYTSRISKSFFEKLDYHNAFVTIGADQVLHMIQLVLTYQWLIAKVQ